MNAVSWFEIPSTDFDRAVKFYESLLGVTMHRELINGTDPNGFFPAQDGVGGAVAKVPYAKPGADGPLIYLYVATVEALNQAVGKVESLGGAVLMPTTSIGPFGFMAIIHDTEGNRVGLHVPPAS
jgi:uncharacterized protein